MRTWTDSSIKLGEKDVHSGQVQISKVEIGIGDAFQPLYKVPILWVTACKQQIHF